MNAYLVAAKYFHPSTVKVMAPTVESLSWLRYPDDLMRFLERVLRTTTKSELAVGPHTFIELTQQATAANAGAEFDYGFALNHATLSFRIQAPHYVTREFARTPGATVIQESTRLVSYTDRLPEVMLPWHLLTYNQPEMAQFWLKGMETEYALYVDAATRFNWKPEEARCFLPNGAKSEVVVTMGILTWRNFLRLQTAPEAEQDMQVVARDILRLIMLKLPTLFQDIHDEVQARIQEKDEWLKLGEQEVMARRLTTALQWHARTPAISRPGTGLPPYGGWTYPQP